VRRIFEPDDEMIPEQTCSFCGEWIEWGDEVVGLDRVDHASCVEDLK